VILNGWNRKNYSPWKKNAKFTGIIGRPTPWVFEPYSTLTGARRSPQAMLVPHRPPSAGVLRQDFHHQVWAIKISSFGCARKLALCVLCIECPPPFVSRLLGGPEYLKCLFFCSRHPALHRLFFAYLFPSKPCGDHTGNKGNQHDQIVVDRLYFQFNRRQSFPSCRPFQRGHSDDYEY